MDMVALIRARSEQLASRGDATSQLAYALSPDMEDDEDERSAADYERAMAARNERITRVFTRAMALDPGNPDIPWLASSRCDTTSAKCRSMQQALLAAEPDNAAVWLREMAWARMRGDEAARMTAFKRAASATRYDMHEGAAALPVVEAYRGLGLPVSCSDSAVQDAISEQMRGGRTLDPVTLVEMMATVGDRMGAATLLMGLDGMCKAQDGGALAADRRADCMRILAAVASGNTAMEQLPATAQMVELLQDDEGAAQWRERLRQQRWMMQEQAKLGIDLDPLSGTDQVSVLQETLRKRDRWPPPDDWLPDDVRYRSLILTGRPPEPRRK